jgi:hypothetical protein
MNAAMGTWKGRWAREAVGMWGMPDAMGREGTLMILQWKSDSVRLRGSPESAPDASGAEPWPTLCNRVLAVDEQEIIRQARWFGSGCSTNPADYAAR